MGRTLKIAATRELGARKEQETGFCKVLETLEGYVEVILGDKAEVAMLEDGQVRHYAVPSKHLTEKDIGEGDDFLFDVVEEGTRVTGSIRAVAGEAAEVPPGGYLSPDDLEVLADPWGDAPPPPRSTR